MNYDHVIDELMLDLVESWCIEPEQIVEIAPLLGLAAGAAATWAVAKGISSAAGKAGESSGKKQADQAIQQSQERARKMREQRLRELVQRRENVRSQLDKAKQSAANMNQAVSKPAGNQY